MKQNENIYQCESPVLFLIFNRATETQIVFDRIREHQPQKLYIAGDGPRVEKGANETMVVNSIRESVLSKIDWECEVKTLFREKNLGCGMAVSTAIDWFFSNEKEGIILEDDCQPTTSFFVFCDHLLKKYRGNPNVLHIGGTNPLNTSGTSNTYLYSNFNRIWGWATWRRAWDHFDFAISNWPHLKKEKFLHRFFDKKTSSHFTSEMDKCFSQEIDTWDYQWFLTRLQYGLAIVPGVNLVSNIGFGNQATHTRQASHWLSNQDCGAIQTPLVSPTEFAPDHDHDKKWSLQITPSKISYLKDFLYSRYRAFKKQKE